MRRIVFLGLAVLAACSGERQDEDMKLDLEGLRLRPLAALGLGGFELSVRP